MYLVEVASLEDLTALESSKDLWNSGKVLKKHPLRGWKTSVWSSCLTAGVIPLCTNALVECVGKGRGMGEEGRWGERGEMEMAEERARSWAQIRRREETWVIPLCCTTLTEEGPQPRLGRPSDCNWKHLPKAFPWDERHSCLSGCPGAPPDAHSACSPLGLIAPDTLSSCQIRTNKPTAVSNLDFFVYIKQFLEWKFHDKGWLKITITPTLETILHGSLISGVLQAKPP